MATPAQHEHWCKGQYASYMADKLCDVCGTLDDLMLVYQKRWWAELSITLWAQTKSNLRISLSRSRITCKSCINKRIEYIRSILESNQRFDSCQETGCNKSVVGRGYCTTHRWAYMRLTGVTPKPMAPRGSGTINSEGYRMISLSKHPNANANGQISEHRKVMSDILGRPLWSNEEVHHKNGIRLDNRPKNLELWISSQPSGQRVVDLVTWANEILDRYSDEIDRGLIF